MPETLDLFTTYRWLLTIVCTVYALVYTWQSLAGWVRYFRSSRSTLVLGHYAGVLLLRVRLRRMMWDLFEIGALLGLLGVIVYWHYELGR